ncbi:MAG TPA: alpha/beta hydrolase [Gaiellaceae bacterium]|jgi:pimeloyl-ACP methyl ester carboxylesterase|nr:alpha/beta hydrolase [Gaiellaceae bacterium]
MAGASATTSHLPVPGATLYFEVRGDPGNPALLLIAGGNTDAAVFEGLADVLAGTFHVLTFDPRGNSRSRVDGAPTSQTIELHAGDASSLLAHIVQEPAIVFGTSSGGLVGLELLASYPAQVRLLIVHEPPATELLESPERYRELFRGIRETAMSQGTAAAMSEFFVAAGISPAVPTELPPDLAAKAARWEANADFFLQHEICEFTAYAPPVTVLRERSDRIVAVGGTASRGQLPYVTAQAVAESLGVPLEEIIGDHGGYLSNPTEFGARLHELIQARLG